MVSSFKSPIVILFLLFFCKVLAPSLSQLKEGNSVIVNGDVKRLYENTPSEIEVFNNDYGFENGFSAFYIGNKPQHGVAVIKGDKILYTPNRNFIGEDKLSYWACNNQNQCDSSTVDIIVIQFDFKPTAIADTIETIYGLSTGATFNLLKNDIDAFDEPFIITIIEQPKNGSIIVNNDNTITPIFNNDFIGNDTLTYRVCDAENDCDTAYVYCSVINGAEGGNIFIPNAFSPNGDGYNDLFYLPQITSDIVMKLTIFTQWGQTVYQNDAYMNNWNGVGNLGAFNGKELVSGTYYYVLVLSEGKEPITGYVYLSR